MTILWWHNLWWASSLSEGLCSSAVYAHYTDCAGSSADVNWHSSTEANRPAPVCTSWGSRTRWWYAKNECFLPPCLNFYINFSACIGWWPDSPGELKYSVLRKGTPWASFPILSCQRASKLTWKNQLRGWQSSSFFRHNPALASFQRQAARCQLVPTVGVDSV